MESPSPEVPAIDGAEPEEELRLGSTERGAAANGVILALTRAARSFLLYEPTNEAIRHFLGALRDAVEGYLGRFGDLPLVVRPFELVVHGEVVYLDRDRERSLAFRLFRDGVRKITLEPGLSWPELLKLLEVLSIRYTGVRQAEDDMVVLLWKAGFQHIQLEAVEGFVPEEEVADGASMGLGVRGRQAEIPPDFDLPAPRLEQEAPVRHRALLPREREALLEEDSAQALPGLCVRLCGELVAAVESATDPLSLADILPALREIRDFLLSEGLLSTVLALVRRISEADLARADDRAERDQLLTSFADERALARLLRSVPRDATRAPPDMVELLELLPGNHLRTLIAVLETEHGEAARRVARALLERMVPRHAAWIAAEMGALPGGVALELFRALAVADPARALDAARLAGRRPETELQLEAVRVLDGLPDWPGVASAIVELLAAPDEEVRVRAMAAAGRRGVRAAFPILAERVRRDAALRLTSREAAAAGEALAQCDPERAPELFRGWMKKRGFWAGVLPGQTLLQWAAVSGVVHLPGDDLEALVKSVADRGGSDLAEHCAACLVRRRRLLRGAR